MPPDCPTQKRRLEVVTNGETFHLQRVEGAWHLPGDLTIASGDVLNGQPESAETLFGDDPYDQRDHRGKVGGVISHQEAKRLANEHLRAEGSSLVALHASPDRRHGVWIVGYRDPSHPDEMLIGGALVVTDDGDVHEIGSTPDAVDRLMMELGRWPGAEPSDRVGPRG